MPHLSQENSLLVAGSSCYLGQILDGAIDQDALELGLVFFLPACKGMLPGKQYKDPPGLGTLPGFLRSPGLDCSVSFESLPLTFWQGLNPAANQWGCFKDIFHKVHKALPGCPKKR